MAEYQAVTKQWGNSLGVIIPKDIVRNSHLKENEKVIVLVLKDSRSVLKETFGLAKGKLKRSTQSIKNSLRAELYD